LKKPVFYTIIILFLLVNQLIAQQNLVYNGSFEEYSLCPTSNELNNGQFERVKGWWRPTFSTPDYYNQCNIGMVGIPNNFWGNQYAFHGNGYVGFGAISCSNNGENQGNEYFRTQLISSLKPCYEYKLTMYVSLAEVSSHGVGDIGAWFSVQDDFVSTMLTISQTPQIVNTSSPIVDTSGWTKIEGTFIAKGFENFLTIGYFRDNMTLDTSFVQSFIWSNTKEALYYVDSVTLLELGPVSADLCSFEMNFPNIITPNGDGINDVLDITNYLGILDEIIIANRWGETVEILNKDHTQWRGDNLTEGIYYYRFTTNWGDRTIQNGFIQLIR
jgi:gliding motility-associated-like protein